MVLVSVYHKISLDKAFFIPDTVAWRGGFGKVCVLDFFILLPRRRRCGMLWMRTAEQWRAGSRQRIRRMAVTHEISTPFSSYRKSIYYKFCVASATVYTENWTISRQPRDLDMLPYGTHWKCSLGGSFSTWCRMQSIASFLSCTSEPVRDIGQATRFFNPQFIIYHL